MCRAGGCHAAADHDQISFRKLYDPRGMRRQFCPVDIAEALAVPCILPSPNNVFGFHDISPFRFRL
jgi:hypothetical protein